MKKPTSSFTMADGVGAMAADQLLKLVKEDEEVLDWTAVPRPDGS